MDQLLEWIQQIAVFYVLATVIEQLLPAAKYRKYVRLYLGLVFVLFVVRPVFDLTSLGTSLTEAMERAQEEIARNHLELEISAGNEMRYAMILSEYQELIREQVAEKVSAKGYYLQKLDVTFEEEIQSADFGKMLAMELVITRVPQGEVWSETVESGEPDEETWHPVMEKIRADLEAEYGLAASRINISFREG